MTELNSEEKSSILIVDDSTDNIDLLIGALGDQYKVQAATDGNRALELVKQGQKPGLIFMDVMMPEMDGYEACKQIKSEPGCEDINVIFVSALDSMENIIKGYEAGGCDYIIKPISPDVVKEKTKLAFANLNYREQTKRDQKIAYDTAMTAIASGGELGVLIEFVKQSFITDNIDTLADEVIKHTCRYGLECSTQLRTRLSMSNRSSSPTMSHLEIEYLSRVKGFGRLIEKSNIFVVNFDHITLLIKNLPECAEKRGRFRDHLAQLAEAAESRIIDLELREELEEIVFRSKITLQDIAYITSEQKKTSLQIIDDVMSELQEYFLSCGLTLEQEEGIASIVQSGIDKSIENLESGIKTDEQMSATVNELEQAVQGYKNK